MIIAALPADEEMRLQDLESYEILGTAEESDFDELVELASRICGTPISTITLLDEERQWFKSKKGLAESSTSRNFSFCSHAILQDEVFIVEDAAKDERFHDNPLVTGAPGIRFYAGAPVISPSGYKVGTICVIDHVPKKLSKEEECALSLIANQVSRLLELRKKNMIIRQRAEEIINLKTKTITTVMKEQEKDKKQIAFTLHEDLAQRLASTLIFLDMAQQGEVQRSPMIATARDEIKKVLVEMRNLTYAITPYTSSWIPAGELVEEFVVKAADSFSFDIKVVLEKTGNRGSPENSLAAIRVLEQWFRILAYKKQVTKADVHITTGEQFELTVTDNGEENTDAYLKELIRDSMIYDRVHSYNGSIEIITAAPGKNILQVKIPVEPEK